MKQLRLIFRSIFIVMFIITFSTSVLAVENYMNFISLEGDQDFSQNITRTILQDNRGYMWFGTNNGLEKYDGYTTKKYRQTPFEKNTLLDNYIVDLEEDDRGNILIATNKGVTKFNIKENKFTHYIHNNEKDKKINSNKIRAIHKDQMDNIWVGTADKGLSLYDEETDSFIPFSLDLTSEKITTIYGDSENKLWIGTEKGLNKVDIETRKVDRYQKGTASNSLSGNYITSICKDSFNELWVGTRNSGLNKINLKENTINKYVRDENNSYSLGSDSITSVLEDNNNTIWIGSTKGGLAKYDRENDHFIKRVSDAKNIQSNRQNNIITLYKDVAGLIWVGIEYGGVNKFNPLANFKNYTTVDAFDNSMNDNNILSIYKDDRGIIWVGTKNGGVNKLDLHNKTIKHYKHKKDDIKTLSSNTINSILKDHKGTLWIGTDSGLNTLDIQTEEIERYLRGNIQHVFEDSRENLWIGSEDGLYRFDRDTNSFRQFNTENSNLSSNYISTIFEDKSGVLWIGTYHDGLNRFDSLKDEFVLYKNNLKDTDTISNDQIKDIIEDEYENLWIGTSNGLNKYDKKTDSFKVFSEQNQLKSNFISGLLEYNGDIWISSNDGISKFNIEREKVIKNYSAIDGLQGNYFNTGAVYKSSDGELLFGGTEGFNTIYPKNEKHITYKPKILLSEFQVNDENMDLDKESITLPYDKNRICFEFNVIDYKKPNNNNHSFMLEGYDKKWHNVKNRNYGLYNNLKPGKYKLKLRGTNSEGEEAKPIEIAIQIKPPFWKTNLAYLIYLLLSILVLYLFLNYVKVLEKIINERSQQLKSTNKKLLKEIDQRKKTEIILKETIDENKKLFEEKMEIEDFRNDFFINLSHELKTPLNIILSTIQLSEMYLKKDNIEIVVDKISKHFMLIRKNCYKLLKIINDIIDVSKLETKQYKIEMNLINMVYLTEDVVSSTVVYAKDKGIDIIFNTTTEEEIIRGDHIELERVILNLISNAIKYNNIGGHIWVDIHSSDNWVNISIKDNGIGIPIDKQETIFEKFKRANESKSAGSGIGLSLSKLLIEMQGGRLSFNSREGVGSEFIISIPKYNIKDNEYEKILDLEVLEKENIDLEIEMSK